VSLRVSGLTRRFQRGTESVLALDAVDLELFPGELVVAAGPSGSGKTTLLSILAGLDTPDAGAVHALPPLPRDAAPGDLTWAQLAFVPQSPVLLDELTIAENIELPARLAGAGRLPGGKWRRSGGGSDGSDEDPDGFRPDGLVGGWEPADRPRPVFGVQSRPSGESADRRGRREADPIDGYPVGQLLAELEIGQLADRYPSQVSGGEQQRTAIGRALRLRPRVLVADEPTGHQDRARVGLVLDLLRRHAYAGYTVLISSHDTDVIRTADRVITLADGRVVTDSYHRVAG
jgi:putative ABC transport system ATP-binding protein